MQWRQIPLAFIGWRPRYVTLKTNGAWFVHTKRCLLGLLFSLNSGIQDSAVSCIVCIVQASSWPTSLAGPHRVSEQLLWLKWGGERLPDFPNYPTFNSRYDLLYEWIQWNWSYNPPIVIPLPFFTNPPPHIEVYTTIVSYKRTVYKDMRTGQYAKKTLILRILNTCYFGVTA